MVQAGSGAHCSTPDCPAGLLPEPLGQGHRQGHCRMKKPRARYGLLAASELCVMLSHLLSTSPFMRSAFLRG